LGELEVKGNEFYVLTVKQEDLKRTIYDEINSPIKKIKDYLKKGVRPEDIELATVEIKEEKYDVKVVPWSTIATGLVK